MSAIRFRDRNGQKREVPYLKGDKGDPGEKGDKGESGIGQEVDGHSAVFNDYENNKTLARYSVGFGTNTMAGYKGFPISQVTLSADSKSMAVVLADKELEEKAHDHYAVGEFVQWDAKQHWYNIFKIIGKSKNADGNTVLQLANSSNVEITHDIALDSDPTENWLWVVGKWVGLPITNQKAVAVFGDSNIAAGRGTVAAGRGNQAIGNYSGTVGRNNKTGYCAFAGGYGNTAMGHYAFSAGSGNSAEGMYSVALGNRADALGKISFAFGQDVAAEGENSVAFNSAKTTNTAKNSVAIGTATANGENSFAQGTSTTTFGGKNAVAMGTNSVACEVSSIAAGDNVHATGFASFACGKDTDAETYSVAGGNSSKAYGACSVALGENNITEGSHSFVMGSNSTTKGQRSVAFGHGNSTGTGAWASAVFGSSSQANGSTSFAAGGGCIANGNYSVAFGHYTEAVAESQAVFGKYSNMTSDMLFGIGDGIDVINRGNAFSVFNDGHAEIKTQGTTANSVVTKQYVDGLLEQIEQLKQAVRELGGNI